MIQKQALMNGCVGSFARHYGCSRSRLLNDVLHPVPNRDGDGDLRSDLETKLSSIDSAAARAVCAVNGRFVPAWTSRIPRISDTHHERLLFKTNFLRPVRRNLPHPDIRTSGSQMGGQGALWRGTISARATSPRWRTGVFPWIFPSALYCSGVPTHASGAHTSIPSPQNFAVEMNLLLSNLAHSANAAPSWSIVDPHFIAEPSPVIAACDFPSPGLLHVCHPCSARALKPLLLSASTRTCYSKYSEEHAAVSIRSALWCLHEYI
ncbi:hypothetical protein C2E23DRAFT_583313 [Lenzites betulinus]|nr:hypothetical protein C2E23DRAFT_583313 [Lenzites betulinus]